MDARSALAAAQDIGPADLSPLLSSFPSWRAGQFETVMDLVHVSRSAAWTVASLPTGTGKSLIGAALFSILGERGATLTSTRTLQDQLARDFPGALLLKGRSNWKCEREDKEFFGNPTVANAPCAFGDDCPLKEGGCGYFDAIRAAETHPFVVSNYQMALLSGALRPETVVLDEAHDAVEELRRSISADVALSRVIDLGVPGVPSGTDRGEWAAWLVSERVRIMGAAEDRAKAARRTASNLVREMARTGAELLKVLRMIDSGGAESFVVHAPERGRVEFTPVDVRPFAKRLKFGGERSILLSATITKAAVSVLIPEGETVEFIERPNPFPVERRRVVIVPAPMVRHQMPVEDWRRWTGTIRHLVEIHRGMNGIVHCGSFDRVAKIAETLAGSSRVNHGGVVLHLPVNSESRWRTSGFRAHDSSKTAVEDFLDIGRKRPGALLLSPSVHTGFDFPGDACRYQIIPKIQFPDPRDAVVAALSKIDKDYGLGIASIKLMQAAGRGVRSSDDWCRTYLVDGNSRWFLSKSAKYMPSWFRDGLAVMHETPSAAWIPEEEKERFGR